MHFLSRDDLTLVTGLGHWDNVVKVPPDSVWTDKTVNGFGILTRLLNLSWGLQGKVQLSTGDLGLSLNWDGSVDRHFNSGTDEFGSEWRNDSGRNLNLGVEDWDDLGSDLWQPLALGWLTLDGSLDGINDWLGDGGGDWKTRLGHQEGVGLRNEGGGNMVEFQSALALNLLGSLFQSFNQDFGVKVQGRLNSGDGLLQESLWALELTDLKVQFGGDLRQLALDSGRGFSGVSNVVQVLLQDSVHALGVDGEVSQLVVHDSRVNDVSGLHGSPDWSQGVLGVDDGQVLSSEGVHVLDESRETNVLRVLDSKLLWLQEWQSSLGLKSNRPDLWVLGDGQVPQGGLDEGGDLLGWLHPGTDGNLLEFGGSWLGPWENGNSSNPDLWQLNWVVDDGQKNWTEFSWVPLGDTLQRVDSQGPDNLLFAEFTLNNLQQRLQGLHVSELSKRGDDDKAQTLLFALKLLGQEWNVFLSQNTGFLGSKDTVDVGWEEVVHGGWLNVSLVEQVAQVNKGSGKKILVGGDSLRLDHLDQLAENSLSWVPDRADGVRNHLDEPLFWQSFGLDLLDDKHGRWVSSDHRQSVVEDLLNGVVSRTSLFLDLLLKLFKLGQAQVAHVLGNRGKGTGNVRVGGAALWGLVNLDGHVLQLVQNLGHELVLWQSNWDQSLWSFSQTWLWEDWADSEDGLGLTDDLLWDGGKSRSLLWESVDQRLDLLGAGWDWEALRDGLDGQELHVDLGSDGGLLISGVTDWVGLDNVLNVDLADVELIQFTADEGGGGGNGL